MFGSVSFAFQLGCWDWIVRFSLLGGGAVCACGYGGFLLWSFVGSALTAVGSFVLVDNVMENQIIRSLSRTNAFSNIPSPGAIGEKGLHHTKLEEMARSAVILRISTAKHHVAAGTYSLSTTNEKRTIQA